MLDVTDYLVLMNLSKKTMWARWVLGEKKNSVWYIHAAVFPSLEAFHNVGAHDELVEYVEYFLYHFFYNGRYQREL